MALWPHRPHVVSFFSQHLRYVKNPANHRSDGRKGQLESGVFVEFAWARRCRLASNRITEPATPALSDSSPLSSGIEIGVGSSARTEADSPAPSAPPTTAIGPVSAQLS